MNRRLFALIALLSPLTLLGQQFPAENVLNDSKAFHRHQVMYRNIPYLIAPMLIYSAERVTAQYDGKDHDVSPRQVCYAQNVLFISRSDNFKAVLSDNVVLQFLEPSKFQITQYMQEPYKELLISREPSSSRFHSWLSYGSLYVGLPMLQDNSSIVIDTPRGAIVCLGGRALIRVNHDVAYIEVVSGSFVFHSIIPNAPPISITDGAICLADFASTHLFKDWNDFQQHNKKMLYFDRPREELFSDLAKQDVIIRRENFFLISAYGDYEYPNAIMPPNTEVSPSSR